MQRNRVVAVALQKPLLYNRGVVVAVGKKLVGLKPGNPAAAQRGRGRAAPVGGVFRHAVPVDVVHHGPAAQFPVLGPGGQQRVEGRQKRFGAARFAEGFAEQKQLAAEPVTGRGHEPASPDGRGSFGFDRFQLRRGGFGRKQAAEVAAENGAQVGVIHG